MFSLERKIGEAVIEGFPIEPYDIGIAADVIGVAMLAFGLGNIRPPAMKPHVCGDVGRDLLMAVKAKLSLLLF